MVASLTFTEESSINTQYGDNWDNQDPETLDLKEKSFPEWMMSQKFLDELRTRVPVSQVVSRRVALKRRQGYYDGTGKGEYYGLSPFKPEKTPSLFVNDQKGIWHEFSTGEFGDIF